MLVQTDVPSPKPDDYWPNMLSMHHLGVQDLPLPVGLIRLINGSQFLPLYAKHQNIYTIINLVYHAFTGFLLIHLHRFQYLPSQSY